MELELYPEGPLFNLDSFVKNLSAQLVRKLKKTHYELSTTAATKKDKLSR